MFRTEHENGPYKTRNLNDLRKFVNFEHSNCIAIRGEIPVSAGPDNTFEATAGWRFMVSFVVPYGTTFWSLKWRRGR
jgi:hypothetical protein